MTLIESALQKMQQQAQKRRPEQPVGGLVRRGPEPISARIESGPPRVFQSASVNAEAMERSCVLPRVTDEAALRAYKIMRTRVLQRLQAGNWRSIVVTGTEAQQGKTLTATNLAYALAQDPHTSVFLVDLDLRRPQIARYLGMEFSKGLSDYLAGNANIEDIIYESGTPRLAIIPNGSAVQHSSELLAAPRMAELARQLQAESPARIIVYDMPPLLMSDDVMVFAPLAEAVLLVVTEGYSDRAAVEKAREVLGEMNLLGVVLNKSMEKNESGYY